MMSHPNPWALVAAAIAAGNGVLQFRRARETGYQYLRARYYDPTTGQFLTVDPLVLSTRQPYSYADGDPANKFDPFGLRCAKPSESECNAKLVKLEAMISRDKRAHGGKGTHGLAHRYEDFFRYGPSWMSSNGGKKWDTHVTHFQNAVRGVKTLVGQLEGCTNLPEGADEIIAKAKEWIDAEPPTEEEVWDDFVGSLPTLNPFDGPGTNYREVGKGALIGIGIGLAVVAGALSTGFGSLLDG